MPRRSTTSKFWTAARRGAVLCGVTVALLLEAPGLAISARAEGFVTIEDGGFTLDGKPFPAVGVNCYYLMVYAAEAGLRDEVDEVLEDARLLGATVVRTWAFNDGADQWNALQTEPGEYSERIFRGLDYVVQKAGEKGLRLLLPLVNNWDDYGGMSRYVEWSSTASTHDDFYTDASTTLWYKDHAEKVLERINTFSGIAYKDDPAILGWELANEPRAAQKGAAVLDGWIAEMSAHLKGIDSRHLVSTGSEGFYGPADSSRNPASWMSNLGVDFRVQHAHATIDFASFHAYPDHWSISPATAAGWARDHFEDAREALGKPVLLGEFGKKAPLSARNDFFRACYDAAVETEAPGRSSAGLLPWILYHDAYPDYDGFGVYYPRDDVTVEIIQDGNARVASAIGPSAMFLRADSNCDGVADLSDPVRTLLVLFAAGGSFCCEPAADANGDGVVGIADAVFGLAYVVTGGTAPPAPFPACDAAPGEAETSCAGNPGCP